MGSGTVPTWGPELHQYDLLWAGWSSGLCRRASTKIAATVQPSRLRTPGGFVCTVGKTHGGCAGFRATYTWRCGFTRQKHPMLQQQMEGLQCKYTSCPHRCAPSSSLSFQTAGYQQIVSALLRCFSCHCRTMSTHGTVAQLVSAKASQERRSLAGRMALLPESWSPEHSSDYQFAITSTLQTTL